MLAHILAAPQFFGKAEATVNPDEYEINFLWLCDESKENSLIEPEKIREILFDPISRWVFYNPGVPINIWYDSKVVSKKAIEDTEKSLLQVIKEVCPEVNHSPFNLLDIRMIEETRKTKTVFSSQIPLFFRIDLLKALILENRAAFRKYVVFSDLDVAAMPSQALFDGSVLKHLSEFGMVMGRSSYTGSHENSFFIFSQHPTIQKFQRNFIIYPSLQEAKKKLESPEYDLDPQKVFGFYYKSLAKDRTKVIQVPRSRFDSF